MANVIALRPDEERRFEGQPKGFPFDGFKVEDVMLPEDDDMGIPSEDDEDDEEEIQTETGFGSVIGEPSALLKLKHIFWTGDGTFQSSNAWCPLNLN